MIDKGTLLVTPNGIVEADAYAGTCNCGGVKNIKYQKGKYVIYFIPKRKVFHIKEQNNYLVKSQPIATLCEKLKSLGFPACVESLSTS